jgi:hypothetical protein
VGRTRKLFGAVKGGSQGDTDTLLKKAHDSPKDDTDTLLKEVNADTLLKKAHNSPKDNTDTLLEEVNVFGAGLKLREASPTDDSNTPENEKEAPTQRTGANPLVEANGICDSQNTEEAEVTTVLFDEDEDDDVLPPFEKEAPT